MPPLERRPWRERLFPNAEWTLLVALACEIAIFAAAGQNFFTWSNFFEVIRLSVELGLVALALTPVILTGGIDLSPGSMMGLAAVLFGVAWRAGLPIPAAIAIALVTGAAGGALNATLITRLRIPPIIVTLGSYSLFRGIAEGITQGAVSYSGFPAPFLRLGQGYWWGVVPVQFPIFLLVLAFYAVLLHRSTIGRTLYAIGFSAAGARYAGIRVERPLALVYVLSGICRPRSPPSFMWRTSGQAKSDAGTGYELAAITAVVLGGTSVFGGRGTMWGTVAGPVFDLRSAERTAPRRAAERAGRRADRRGPRLDHRARPRLEPAASRAPRRSSDTEEAPPMRNYPTRRAVHGRFWPDR